jgi:hypothetical protein
MSSTVTTATVSTVTAAITIEGLGQALILATMLLLGLALLAKEFAAVSNGKIGRAISRGLDIGVLPLASVFLLVIAINMVTFVGGG